MKIKNIIFIIIVAIIAVSCDESDPASSNRSESLISISTSRDTIYQNDTLELMSVTQESGNVYWQIEFGGGNISSNTGEKISFYANGSFPKNTNLVRILASLEANVKYPEGRFDQKDIWVLTSTPDTTDGGKDTIDISPKDTSICFESEILPIFSSSCAFSGCHINPGAPDRLDFSTYEGIIKKIRPGKPTDGDIMEAILDTDEADRMPPSPYNRLSDEKIELLQKWIKEGAKNTKCEDEEILNPTYQDVSKILSINCTSCHNDNLSYNGIKLLTYEQVKGVAESSLLENVIEAKNGYPQMPPSNPLSVNEIKIIKDWISGGLKEN